MTERHDALEQILEEMKSVKGVSPVGQGSASGTGYCSPL